MATENDKTKELNAAINAMAEKFSVANYSLMGMNATIENISTTLEKQEKWYDRKLKKYGATLDAASAISDSISTLFKATKEPFGKDGKGPYKGYSKPVDEFLNNKKTGIVKIAADLEKALKKKTEEVKNEEKKAGTASKVAEVAKGKVVDGSYCCNKGASLLGSTVASGQVAGLEGVLAQPGQGNTEAGKLNDVIKQGGKKQTDLGKDNNEKQIAADKAMWDSRVNLAGKGAGAMANIMQNLYTQTGAKSKAMFNAMKAFAIAETVIQTYRAAQGAYAAMAKINPVLGIAAAAAAVVAGMARVSAIARTQPGQATATVNAKGKANPAYKGGSTNAGPPPVRLEDARPTQNVTVVIHNPLSQQNWAEIAEAEIIPAINDAVENRNINLSVKTVS